MAADTSQELRALQVFDTIPEGCILHTQRSGAHLPHVKPGELAVVDLNDRGPDHGELFLIRWENGDHDIMQTAMRHCERIVQPDGSTAPEDLWMLHPLNRPRSREECDAWIAARKPLHLSDGPYPEDYLRTKIVGRVIGIFEPAAAAADS